MKRPTLAEQIASKCVHFTGLGRGPCKKGMNYNDVDRGMRIEYRSGLPCFKPDKDALEKLNGRQQCHCPHVQFPSDEEVQRQVRDYQEQMKKFTVALAAVEPIRKKYKGSDFQGVIECPVCKGKLHIRHSGYNGHVWANCETKECVNWIE